MISLVYVTARPDFKPEWFFDSICLQAGLVSLGQIIIIDFFAQACDGFTESDVEKRKNNILGLADRNGVYNITEWHPPKPNVWGGKYRLTKNNWWHVAACRNTGLCYAKHDFITFLDDRCVLMPTWMDAAREAEENKYAVCGTYEKRDGMVVTDGVITHGGIITGEDGRFKHAEGNKMTAPGQWMYGCTFGLPTEWMLSVNGVDESWDSVSMEDTHFGQMLQNNGYPIYFDPRMKMIEDRSPIAPPHNMKRESKEKHPNDTSDKTHTLIKAIWNNKRSDYNHDLREQRRIILSGGHFPIPESPTVDWFDSQPLREM